MRERLYSSLTQGIDFDGKLNTGDSCAYPMFRQMRAPVKNQAELLAIALARRNDLMPAAARNWYSRRYRRAAYGHRAASHLVCVHDGNHRSMCWPWGSASRPLDMSRRCSMR